MILVLLLQMFVMIDCHPQFVVDDIGRHTPGLENSL
jgi:hypothetical protein